MNQHMKSKNNISVYTRYSRLGASSRVRFFQFIDGSFSNSSLFFDVDSLFDSNYLNKIYNKRRVSLFSLIGYYLSRLRRILLTDKNKVLWIEKELFPYTPAFVERILLNRKKYILDYDDATFHTYDCHKSKWVRLILGKKIDSLMAGADLVVVGNNYLYRRALDSGAKNIVIVPSVIDLDRYSVEEKKRVNDDSSVVIGWIGSPGSQHLLKSVLPALKELAKTRSIKFRFVGVSNFSTDGLDAELVPWNENTEVDVINSFDIGIMPVQNEPFQRGKCGFKLIQYMACSKPVLGSPVGFNMDVVNHGVNGFLPESDKEWVNYAQQLIDNPDLRAEMGRVGRERVENNYCIQAVSPVLEKHLISVC